MPFETWDDVEQALLRALGRLDDGDFLVLSEPTQDPPRRRGPFGRRTTPAARYVQVLRSPDVYTAECVGARSLGGTWEMDEATITALRALGWGGPDQDVGQPDSVTPNFELYVDPQAGPTLVRILASSLQRLGATPADLTLQTSGP